MKKLLIIAALVLNFVACTKDENQINSDTATENTLKVNEGKILAVFPNQDEHSFSKHPRFKLYEAYFAKKNQQSRTAKLSNNLVRTYVPDPFFRAILLDYYGSEDGVIGDNYININNASDITVMTIQNDNIKDFTGIEVFTKLEGLQIYASNLTLLDVSKLTELIYLEIAFTVNLSNLDLSKNNKLEIFEYGGGASGSFFINDLSTLTLPTDAPNLWFLSCFRSKIKTLNLDGVKNITEMFIEYSELTSLNLSKLTLLKKVYLDYNHLTTLNFDNNINLVAVSCYYSPYLTEVSCENNNNSKFYYTAFNSCPMLNTIYVDFDFLPSAYNLWPNKDAHTIYSTRNNKMKLEITNAGSECYDKKCIWITGSSFISNETYVEIRHPENGSILNTYTPNEISLTHNSTTDKITLQFKSQTEIDLFNTKGLIIVVKNVRLGLSSSNFYAASQFVPLYRYYRAANGKHFYTTNFNELGNGAGGYVLEGIECKVSKTQIANTIPFYRYYNTIYGNHFYTTNLSELGFGVPSPGWRYEEIHCYIYPNSGAGLIPLYRYYNHTQVDHFYTTSFSELGNGQGDWKYEGIAGYVQPS